MTGTGAIIGATVLDGTGGEPVAGGTIVYRDGRIESTGPADQVEVPADVPVTDASGKFVIPGLLDANVHLFPQIPDYILLHRGRYEELIIEGAQLALSGGVTTVFDTCGPVDALIAARDSINRGDTIGSRMFVAGNIIGFPGPLAAEHAQHGNLLGGETLAAINADWEKGTGPDTWWLTPEHLAERVRAYIEQLDVDFIKYAASAHDTPQINYSARAQTAIIDTAHAAGLPVQAHTMSVESLRMAVEAGVDLLTHPNVTGSEPIPSETIDLIVANGIPSSANLWTERYMEFALAHWSTRRRTYYGPYVVENCRRLIEAGAELVLTTDGFIAGPRTRSHPYFSNCVPIEQAPDFPYHLGHSHLLWFEAAAEQGMTAMDALVSATQGVAKAYRKDGELGTLEPGKIADLIVLDADPLVDPRNYRRISDVVKDGRTVDLAALPQQRLASDDISV
jgi:imidazolonepropionase-like amidohydrolase